MGSNWSRRLDRGKSFCFSKMGERIQDLWIDGYDPVEAGKLVMQRNRG